MAVTKGMSPTGTRGVLGAKGTTSGATNVRKGRRKASRKSKRY